MLIYKREKLAKLEFGRTVVVFTSLPLDETCAIAAERITKTAKVSECQSHNTARRCNNALAPLAAIVVTFLWRSFCATRLSRESLLLG